jgi:hypothetical protein
LLKFQRVVSAASSEGARGSVHESSIDVMPRKSPGAESLKSVGTMYCRDTLGRTAVANANGQKKNNASGQRQKRAHWRLSWRFRRSSAVAHSFVRSV